MKQAAELSIERILCPIDFSDGSRAALDHALAIAAAYAASVTMLHVMPQSLMHPELFPYLKEPILVPPEIRDRALERLERLAQEISGESPGVRGVPVEWRLESGEPAHRIVSMAESLPAELVVAGTRGRGGLERLVLGSVAERLLTRARTPTLVVEKPPARAPGEGLPYRRILMVEDGSDRHALDREIEWAVSFRRKAGGELVIARVPEPRDGSEPAREGRLDAGPGAGLAALGLEEDAVELLELDPIRPEAAIRRLARKAGAGFDLIVLGSFGPTARELVRSAERPVLVLNNGYGHPEDREEEN